MAQQKKDPKKDQKKDKKSQQTSNWTAVITSIIFLVVVLIVAEAIVESSDTDTTVTDDLITSEFVQAVEQGRVTSVTYSAGEYTLSGTYYPAITAGATGADAFNDAFSALNALMATETDDTGSALAGVSTTTLDVTTLGTEHNFTSTYYGSLSDLMNEYSEIPFEVELPSAWLDVVATLLPIILIAVILFFFYAEMAKANNSQMSFGKAKTTKKSIEEHPDVKFSDVAGIDEAVEEMKEIKDYLANPAKYQSMGAKIPRGVLLVGPPGTGKTLLARAVAGEAGVPFFSISGSDFVEMFVGVGASRVRDLFQQAKDAAPSIIFIDEIDAVGRQRGTGLGGGHDEREQTLNQLLVEMDGFEPNESVVLIAATNRADVLDPALLRPGRFDRQIVVNTPDVRGRERILEVHAKDKPLGSDVDLKKLAQLTSGFTGADLANLLNEAALLAARRGKRIITQQEVSESMERVIAGPERKGFVLDEHTKRTIAYHESGHALVGHTLEHADPVHKISIVARGQALGYTLSIPNEDKVMSTLGEMRDELAVFMGGRVAEEIFCDDVTTGASNDLERATKMARAMVTQYGMSSELGTQVFGEPNHEVFLGRDYGNTQDYSEETARRIDEEVSRIMKEAHDRAYEVLSTHQEQMHLMASVLLERETVEGEACQALLDNRWDEYLAHEDEIIAAKEAEEAAARARDVELYGPDVAGAGQGQEQDGQHDQMGGAVMGQVARPEDGAGQQQASAGAPVAGQQQGAWQQQGGWQQQDGWQQQTPTSGAQQQDGTQQQGGDQQQGNGTQPPTNA